MRKPDSPDSSRYSSHKSPSRLKTALSAGVLALAGGFANKAEAQTRFDLPRDNGDYVKINKLENPNIVQFSYSDLEANAQAIDYSVSREGNSVVLTQLSGVKPLSTPYSSMRTLVSDGAGCQNEFVPAGRDEWGQQASLLNGIPVWINNNLGSADCDVQVKNSFPTRNGKIGLEVYGSFGTAGAAYGNNNNGVTFEFDTNSSDWCADYKARINGINPLIDPEISDRILATSRMEDYIRADGAIRMILRYQGQSPSPMAEGVRYAAQDETDTGPYRYFQSYDNGNTYVLDPQQVNGGNPVPANDYVGIDLTGAVGLKNVVLTYGGVNEIPGALPALDAHEKVITTNPDGTKTVTLLRLPVVIREGFVDDNLRDADQDGIPDNQDANPGINAPGGDLNRATSVACFLSNPANQIGNGLIACDSTQNGEVVMARKDGSRLFTDGGDATYNLNAGGDVLTVGNISAIETIFEWDHAWDVSSGEPRPASPNITFTAPLGGKAYVVDVNLISNIGFDGLPHDVQILNNAADLLNQVPLVINAPTDGVVRYEFAPHTIPVFALKGTVIGMAVHEEDVAGPDAVVDAKVVPVDANSADAAHSVDGASDAANSADGANVVDGGNSADAADSSSDVISQPSDGGADASDANDAHNVIFQPAPDGALPLDSGVSVDAAQVVPVDAAQLPVDANLMPLDSAQVVLVDAANSVDLAPLPVDLGVPAPDAPAPATLPVDAAVVSPDLGVQQADAAVVAKDAGQNPLDSAPVSADAAEQTDLGLADASHGNADATTDAKTPVCAPGMVLKERGNKCVEAPSVIKEPAPATEPPSGAEVPQAEHSEKNSGGGCDIGGNAPGGKVPTPLLFVIPGLLARNRGRRQSDQVAAK